MAWSQSRHLQFNARSKEPSHQYVGYTNVRSMRVELIFDEWGPRWRYIPTRDTYDWEEIASRDCIRQRTEKLPHRNTQDSKPGWR
jgi:hypothetical protein